MDKKATVPVHSNSGAGAATAAPTTTTTYVAASTGMDPNRSDSQPPTGRMTTAMATNPAIRLAASAGVRSYSVLR